MEAYWLGFEAYGSINRNTSEAHGLKLTCNSALELTILDLQPQQVFRTKQLKNQAASKVKV